MTTTGKNQIMIDGPKDDGTYVVEFKTAAGEALAISTPRTETAVIRHLQERKTYGVPLRCDAPSRRNLLLDFPVLCGGRDSSSRPRPGASKETLST
jgi:hypothetical protein